MTEQDWLTSVDPRVMLALLTAPIVPQTGVPWQSGPASNWSPNPHPPSDRKLHLFEDSCFEQLGLNLEDVTVQTRPAAEACHILRDIFGNPWRPHTLDKCLLTHNRHTVHTEPCVTGRDLYVTSTVRDIAQTIYDDRHFDELPILADALVEMGCSETKACPACRGSGFSFSGPGGGQRSLMDCPVCCSTGHISSLLLSHLRDPGPHVRGCWALDLVLGKE